MIKNALLALMIACASSSAMAQITPVDEMPSGIYHLDKNHASVTWKISHLGLSHYTARFATMDATLLFDAKDPIKSTLRATVDPASIRTDYPNHEEKDFDAILAKDKEWFNAGAFPNISFESTKVEKTGEHTGKVHGTLTMLGVTKPLVLDVTFNRAYINNPFANAPTLGFSATTTLMRSDWGLKNYVPMIGDEVRVFIEVEFNKAR